MMATAAAVAFIVYSCKGKLAEADALDLNDTPVQIVNDMFIVQSKNSNMEMRAEAPLMKKYENDSLSYELFPEGFFVFGYDENGNLETDIVADNARHMKYEDGRESWEAFGNVVVKNLINQEVMETDTLYWDQEKELLYTHCHVQLYSPKGFLQGYGMESDQRARSYIIHNQFSSYAIMTQDSTKVVIDSVNFIGPFRKQQ